jgi:hypothetical protein
MRTFHEKYASNTFSQTGEDGILAEVFRRLKIDKGACCEFGAHDGKFCSNTRLLLENCWTVLLLEASPEHAKSLIDNTISLRGVRLYFGPVTPDNVNTLVPQRLNLLSIDIDNDDYNVWNAYQGIADVVVIEVNSSKPPGVFMTPGKQGSSYSSMVQLGIQKGYFLLCHHGNCIFMLNKYRDLFPEIMGDGMVNAEEYFSRAWLTN